MRVLRNVIWFVFAGVRTAIGQVTMPPNAPRPESPGGNR
jgi:hypothetical protein